MSGTVRVFEPKESHAPKKENVSQLADRISQNEMGDMYGGCHRIILAHQHSGRDEQQGNSENDNLKINRNQLIKNIPANTTNDDRCADTTARRYFNIDRQVMRSLYSVEYHGTPRICAFGVLGACISTMATCEREECYSCFVITDFFRWSKGKLCKNRSIFVQPRNELWFYS